MAKPATHVHVYMSTTIPLPASEHAAPFTHGDDAHSSMSMAQSWLPGVLSKPATHVQA